MFYLHNKFHDNWISSFRGVAMTRFWDGRTDRRTDGVTALLDLLSPLATQVKSCNTIDQIVKLETFIHDAFVNKERFKSVSVFFGLEKTMIPLEKYGILKDLHNIGLNGHLPNFIKMFRQQKFQYTTGIYNFR